LPANEAKIVLSHHGLTVQTSQRHQLVHQHKKIKSSSIFHDKNEHEKYEFLAKSGAGVR
jgi:hypothetical protein